MKSLKSTLLLLLFTAFASADTTYVSGTIVNQTWTQSGSPYFVVGDILVAGLTVHPGVRIICQGNYVFEVAGILTAVGTQLDSIRFTKADTASAWRGIWFNHSVAGSEMAYCIVEKARSRGILIENSFPTIRNSCIRNNSASAGSLNTGAGIRSNVPLTLIDCVIEHNADTSSAGPGGTAQSYGAGIYCDTSVTLTRCRLSRNILYAAGGGSGSRGQSRGAAIFASGVITLSSCTIDSNVAFGTAAGQFNSGGWARGGGAYLRGNSTIQNCVFSDNIASGSREQLGGGVYSERGTIDVFNSSFAYNTNQGFKKESGGASIKNSIVYFNAGEQISDTTVLVTYSNVLGGFEGVGNVDFNPVFLSRNNLIIVPGSPCIDAGDPGAIHNDGCLPPALGTTRNDMGAHGGPSNCGWIVTSINAQESDHAQVFMLAQNYPNPFNPTTTIRYQLPKGIHATLKMFDFLGQEVAVLVDGFESPGEKSVQWNADGLASGVYFYRIQAGSFIETKKLMLLK